jgi:hypothetical protein
MTKQRDMLPGLVSEIISRLPESCVLLTGSLQRGEEHPGSDIDLLVVVPDVRRVAPWAGTVVHLTPVVKVVEADTGGVHVTYNFIGAALFDDMTAKPWKYYQFSKANVLHAHGQALAAVRAHILEWFSQRPDITALWREQEETHRKAKRSPGSEALRFPSATDFAEHIDKMITAEQCAGRDGKPAHQH